LQHGATDTVYEAHIFFDNAYDEDGQYNEYVYKLLDLVPFFVPDPSEYVHAFSKPLTHDQYG
jgi:hypothetical protein